MRVVGTWFSPPLAKWGVAALLGTGIATVNRLPNILASYPTAVPLRTFEAISGVSLFVAVFLAYILSRAMTHPIPSSAPISSASTRRWWTVPAISTLAVTSLS